MSGGGISTSFTSWMLMPRSFKALKMISRWFEKRLGIGDLLAAQVLDPEDGRVLADHHRRAVAVAQVDDLDRHPLLAQRHGQRREDEGRLRCSARNASFSSGQPLNRTGSKIPSPASAR